MSEKLTAEEFINKKYRTRILCKSTKWVIRDVMEEYAAQQVQQIKEERDKAISLALSYRSGGITDPEKDFEAMEFLTSIETTNG